MGTRSLGMPRSFGRKDTRLDAPAAVILDLWHARHEGGVGAIDYSVMFDNAPEDWLIRNMSRIAYEWLMRGNTAVADFPDRALDVRYDHSNRQLLIKVTFAENINGDRGKQSAAHTHAEP